jgi:hypothetical protein
MVTFLGSVDNNDNMNNNDNTNPATRTNDFTPSEDLARRIEENRLEAQRRRELSQIEATNALETLSFQQQEQIQKLQGHALYHQLREQKTSEPGPPANRAKRVVPDVVHQDTSLFVKEFKGKPEEKALSRSPPDHKETPVLLNGVKYQDGSVFVNTFNPVSPVTAKPVNPDIPQTRHPCDRPAVCNPNEIVVNEDTGNNCNPHKMSTVCNLEEAPLSVN